MKESTKVNDNILNEYIMNNNSEIPQTNKHLLTPHSLKNNLNIKIQSRRNSLKNKKPKKYNPNTTNNIKASFQYNNFIKAIETNKLQKVKECLTKDIININLYNKNGISPLHIAVIGGNLEIINLLLDKGANPNILSLQKKQTPLHYAYIFKNMNTNKIINLLLKYNANPNLEDINNKKPKEYSLKYKESSDVDNFTLSNDEENLDDKNEEKKISNNENYFSESYIDNNNNKNTYSISDSEDTIIQRESRRSNILSIDELINSNKPKYNTEKIKIISKKNRIAFINNYQMNNKQNNSLSTNKNNYNIKENDTFIDSLEASRKNYNNNTFNINLNHIKGKLRNQRKNSNPRNLKLNKDILFKDSTKVYDILKTDNNKKNGININKQYFINNEFFNNYYNGQEDYFHSKIVKKLFKVPKTKDRNTSIGIMSSSMASTDIQTNKKYNSNLLINNNVTEFVYTEEQSNTDTTNLQKLKNWLDSIQLSIYYNNFLNNNITDINALIKEFKNNREKFNYQYIENLLNIHLAGHIYRILSKLEVDGSFVENKICMFLLGMNSNNEENNSNKNLSKVFIQSDEYSDKCYNCFKSQKSLMQKNDLKTFLRKYKIMHLYDNFYHNGFDLINFVILQMFTKFAINDEIIQKSFHIYNKKDRYFVLDALFSEVKEINIFFSTNLYNCYLFPKYENNDWGINWNEDSVNGENENHNDCNIF